MDRLIHFFCFCCFFIFCHITNNTFAKDDMLLLKAYRMYLAYYFFANFFFSFSLSLSFTFFLSDSFLPFPRREAL